jgi:hypothetical protein
LGAARLSLSDRIAVAQVAGAVSTFPNALPVELHPRRSAGGRARTCNLSIQSVCKLTPLGAIAIRLFQADRIS